MPEPETSHHEKIQAFLQPKQILFISADLVGSTAMKQHRRNVGGKLVPDNELWSKVIQGLYSQSTERFRLLWNQRRAEMSEDFAARNLGYLPILWKTIGDEVIFRKYISSADQVLETLRIWKRAVSEIQFHLQDIAKNQELEIKCTAWVAEFPIQNRVLVGTGLQSLQGLAGEELEKAKQALMENSLFDFAIEPVGAGTEIDFIGPAIDIGFRLTKLSSARKFVISIDTAYLLTVAAKGSLPDLKLYYDGPIRLSGVFGGIAYPTFWIDMADPDSSEALQDKMSGKRELRTDDVTSFCKAFYMEKSNFVDSPFILTDSRDYLRVKPDWYDEAIERARDAYDI